MGTLLYQKEGIEGLSVCDNSFGFGCYHQFFVEAIGGYGVEVIPELDRVCVEAYGPLGIGCQHGIGHGLVEYFGYDDGDLLKELALCTMTTVVNDYFGCISGIFMQYNLPATFDGMRALSHVRAFDPQEPTAPCNDFIPDTSKKACYFALAQWWSALFDPVAVQAGMWCLEDPLYREACYLGLGNILAYTEEYDPVRLIEVCELMPDRDAKILCRAGASWAIFAESSKKGDAPKLCEGLSLEEKNRLVGAFIWLIKEDKKQNPKIYQTKQNK